EVAQLVADHPKQPSTKRPSGRIVIEPCRRARDGAEDLLGEVRGVGILEPLFLREPVNQRRVDIHKFRPRLAVARVLDSRQQAWPGDHRFGHAFTLFANTAPSRESIVNPWVGLSVLSVPPGLSSPGASIIMLYGGRVQIPHIGRIHRAPMQSAMSTAHAGGAPVP